MKLEKCVSTILIGFQCIDDIVTASQFLYKDGETKNNFLAGDFTDLAEYVLDHFTPPGSTILDMCSDPAGMSMYHIFVAHLCDRLSKNPSTYFTFF